MQKDWKQLSKAASREQDPTKLLNLVNQLDQALEQCEKALKEKHRVTGGDETDGKSTRSTRSSQAPADGPPLCA